MSGYVIEIPQEKENSTIWSRQLRVAAYCRVSTPYEEQQKSLEKQIEYFTQYIKRNPFWRFVAVYADNASGLHAKNRPGYQKMLKDCRKGKIDLILVKSLSRFGRDIEIEFLQRVVVIENYFHVAFNIPEEITAEDHRLMDRIYSMIIDDKYCGTCSHFTMSFELSQELRNSICDLGDRACGFAYNMDVEANLFDQKLSFRIIRKIDYLRLENFEKTNAKLDVLDDGDILKIVFVSGIDNSDVHYSDMFYSEETEKRLFQSSVS